MNCLVLDAMGVIFAAADDVGELLVPFIAEHAGSVDAEEVQDAYLAASLGQIDAEQFWQRVGVAAELEDEYLSRHSLNPGILELLLLATERELPVWCLSNDLGSWSQKLRLRLGIEPYLAGVVISGDIGARKPAPEIYRFLLAASGYNAGQLLFVDDREKNLRAARQLGIESIHYNPEHGFDAVQQRVNQFDRGKQEG